MATTWIKPIHRSGGSIAAALDRSVDYIGDADKTNDGELIDSYECDPCTAQSEFLFSKRLYEQRTGRDQGKHDVIAYHVRMSFRPGEVSADKALELGRELALRWTRGRHQFILAAHTNTNNPHAHIIFNSVNLEATHKFSDFKRSAIALRRVSDQICLEHGLSVIEKPGLSKGYNRDEYLGGEKVSTVRDRLRDLIDATLSSCKDFNSFLAAMQAAGCEVKRGKYLAFKLPDGKKFVRCKSLGDDYSEDAIRERVSGTRVAVPRQKVPTPPKPGLLIDIQAKMQQGYSEGYRRWATGFNLKESARTLTYLQERGLDNYDLLADRTAAAVKRFDDLNGSIKATENRMSEISALQKHIGAYGKTREVYKQYMSLPQTRRDEFFETHRADIMRHQAAKKHFDSLGLKKLPPMQSLRTEYAKLAAEKKKRYQGYRSAKDEMTELLRAKSNVDRLLGIDRSREKSYRHDRDGL
jgi:hypothetical protein